MRRPVPALLTLATLAALLAGCGDDDTSSTDNASSGSSASSSASSSEDQPRATVLQFLDDVKAGKTEEACAALAPEVFATVRNNTLMTLAPEGAPEDRMASLLKANKESKTCPGTMKLVASQREDEIASLRAAAEKAKAIEGSGDTWSLEGQKWVLKSSGDTWTITQTGL
ncbi:MAG: hypothetical protein JHD16_08985 [Solirubrobacteraceae bacterium]|nr:hypothetical protein [Solirubrobacteraceae bacterium]